MKAAVLHAFLRKLQKHEPGLVQLILDTASVPSVVVVNGSFGVEVRYQICGAEIQTGASFTFKHLRRCSFDAWAPEACHHLKSAPHYLWCNLRPWQQALIRDELRCAAQVPPNEPFDIWPRFKASVKACRRCWLRVRPNPIAVLHDDDIIDPRIRKQRGVALGAATSIGRRGGVDYRLPKEALGIECRFATVFE